MNEFITSKPALPEEGEKKFRELINSNNIEAAKKLLENYGLQWEPDYLFKLSEFKCRTCNSTPEVYKGVLRCSKCKCPTCNITPVVYKRYLRCPKCKLPIDVIWDKT
jgi:hypothetical protein